MHSYQITQKTLIQLLALLNSFQQGHIGNTENIGNMWTIIKSNIQKHTKTLWPLLPEPANKHIVKL